MQSWHYCIKNFKLHKKAKELAQGTAAAERGSISAEMAVWKGDCGHARLRVLQELSSLDEKLEKVQKAEERATKQRASVKLTARPACLRRLPNCSMSCRQAGPEAQQSLKPGDKLRVLRHSQKLRHRTKPQPLRCNVMLQRPRPKQPPKSTTCLQEMLQQHRQPRRQPSKYSKIGSCSQGRSGCSNQSG